jgi:hypothetical protein
MSRGDVDDLLLIAAPDQRKEGINGIDLLNKVDFELWNGVLAVHYWMGIVQTCLRVRISRSPEPPLCQSYENG